MLKQHLRRKQGIIGILPRGHQMFSIEAVRYRFTIGLQHVPFVAKARYQCDIFVLSSRVTVLIYLIANSTGASILVLEVRQLTEPQRYDFCRKRQCDPGFIWSGEISNRTFGKLENLRPARERPHGSGL